MINKMNIYKLKREDALEAALFDLKKQWAMKNLEIEIKVSQGSRLHQSPSERELIKFSLQSNTNKNFLMHILRATYEDNAITASQLKEEVGCSKRTLDTKIKECEDEKWIAVSYCNKGYRHIKGEQILVDTYQNYTNWLRKSSFESSLSQITIAIDGLQKQIDQEG